MSDYIKREDALRAVGAHLYMIPIQIYDDISDLPSADVVEVVRCKDCRHNGSIDTDCPFGWKDKKFNMPKLNDYCSYGERKGNE